MTEVEKLEALAKAATPGPWKFSPWHVEEASSAVRAPEGWIVANTSGDANAAFIAAANPQAILTLIQEKREMEAVCEKKDAEIVRLAVELGKSLVREEDYVNQIENR